jgi:hypothetical protein
MNALELYKQCKLFVLDQYVEKVSDAETPEEELEADIATISDFVMIISSFQAFVLHQGLEEQYNQFVEELDAAIKEAELQEVAA